jgi:hypothetical protein
MEKPSSLPSQEQRKPTFLEYGYSHVNGMDVVSSSLLHRLPLLVSSHKTWKKSNNRKNLMTLTDKSHNDTLSNGKLKF